MSLLTICTRALQGIGGVDVPGSFYGNSNRTATQAVRLVEEEGAELAIESRWTALITSTTVVTVAGTATYALPSDFQAFANMSQWDRTNFRPLIGPLSGADWQARKSSIAGQNALYRGFRIRGGYLEIDPTPTAVETLAFDYYSSGWITKQADGTYTDTFTSDNDTCRLNEHLLRLGLKWRYLQGKGLPFEPEYKIYESQKASLLEDEAGKGPICLGPVSYVQTNLPDQGYGS